MQSNKKNIEFKLITNKLVCEHCKRTGHNKNKCFQLGFKYSDNKKNNKCDKEYVKECTKIYNLCQELMKKPI
jgi:hypothetical protein